MKLAKLVREEIPSIIVIADKSDLKWRETLKKLGVEIWSFEIYKSARGLHIYRTIGNFPRKPCEDAHCVWSAHIQLTMEVIGNIVIKTSGTSGHISISYEGRQTRWELLVHNLRRYLVFKGGICPLNVNGNYRLVRDKNFNYSFENA